MAQVQTATIAEAHKLVALRGILQMPNHGIFGQVDANTILSEEEFSGNPPAKLLIKVVDRQRPEDSADVDAFDDYINVGATWDTLKRASHIEDGIRRMFAMENIGMSDAEINNRIDNLPGVESAWRTAVKKAIEAL